MKLLRLLPFLLVAGCTLGGEDDDPNCTGGKCDGDDVDQSCSDKRYDDGVCQPQLDCAVPDIDCFEMFEDDAKAAEFFSAFEVQLAAEEGRAPRAVIAQSDPRYTQARDLLDRGWDAFRKHRPVGLLTTARPAVVVIDDPTINAFVIPDTAAGKSALIVMVQTGLLAASSSDDALLGLMMHELQHAVGLHLIADTRDRLRTFYSVPESGEPIGNQQRDDAHARTAGVAWRGAASEIGQFAQVELGGMSIGGDLDRILLAAIGAGQQNDPARCANGIALANQLRDDVRAGTDELDGVVTIDLAGFPARVAAVHSALRDECLAGFSRSFVEVAAAALGTTPAVIEAGLSDHDRALVTGVHMIDAMFAIVADRRATMREAEAQFEADTNRPFSALRYFSTEEDADDVSVTVLRGASLDPAGIGGFLLAALVPALRTRCQAILDDHQTPAYGTDLADEHHATCWRVDHVHAVA
ncbi:MAG: M48 family metalloprotease, partial [Kofleriaceae bacterium]